MLKEISNENSKVISIDRNNFVKKREFKKLDIPAHEKDLMDHWFKHQGNYYFFKYVDGLNEFIGQYLAEYFSLETAKYFLVEYNGNIQVASQYFKMPEYKYFDTLKLGEKINLQDLLTPKYSDVRNDLLKLFAIDIYMRQCDRTSQNLLFKQDKEGVVSLAPAFDYSNSFYYSKYKKYETEIISFDLLSDEFQQFLANNQKLREYLINLDNLDIEKVLKYLEHKFAIDILKEYRDYYLKQDEISKKLIKRII